jgi:hypothetical protein
LQLIRLKLGRLSVLVMTALLKCGTTVNACNQSSCHGLFGVLVTTN